MSTTPHLIAPEEIMAHLDGELAAGRTQAVSAHLSTCAECRSIAEELQQTKHTLGSWQVAHLPAAIENHIQSAAARFPTDSDTSNLEIFRRLRLWSWKQRLGAAFAAVATAAVLLLTLSVPRSWRLEESKTIPVDFARINTQRVQEQESIPASRSINGRKSKAEGVVTPTMPSAVPDSNVALNGRSVESFAKLAPGVLSRDGQPISDQQSRVSSGPMIARTASLTILVKDFDASRNSLDAILARHNSYSATLTVSTPQGSARSLQASLRVPAPHLAVAFAELKALGHVENENQSGEEVSQQHADLVARLKNSRETEQRLQAILTERTGKISDVLEVEQEIARVRGEIEQMEAEQKNLEHRVDFATIDLNLSEEYKAKLDSAAPSISTKFHNALINGYRNVADTLLGLLLFFAEYGPILLFWAFLLFIPAWFVWRRWRHATAAI